MTERQRGLDVPIPSPVRILIAAAASVVLASCSGTSTSSPGPFYREDPRNSQMGRVPAPVNALGAVKMHHTGRHFTTFNSCPSSGPITYISDYNNNIVNIYTAPFAGQTPCGRLTGLTNPEGLFVAKNHDLYVANTGGYDILVFKRSATKPYNTYNDGLSNYTSDVTVANDGTVIAANSYNSLQGYVGSISTWKGGPGGGTFVGNFIDDYGNPYFVTVQKNGTVYFDDTQIWTGSCPLGQCGFFNQTQVFIRYLGGLRSADGEDLVVNDQAGADGGQIDTFETFPTPDSQCSLGAGDPVGIELNKSQHRIFWADAVNNVGGESFYPGCARVGTVPGTSGGLPIGVAHDSPESL